MFLQIHTLTSYHGSLLNRDDAGLAKRIAFGDTTRMRVSSQCLKRHWREQLKCELTMPHATRSRHFFEREILPRVCAEGVDKEIAIGLIKQLIDSLMKEKVKDQEGNSEESGGEKKSSPKKEPSSEKLVESLFLKQPVLFGKPEADYFVALVKTAAKERDPEKAKKALDEKIKQSKDNFKAVVKDAVGESMTAGFEGAMFGRFVTSDILARVDAAVHVAHAFTVHRLDNEVDYFTVVDDLNLEDETGAAHAGDMELGAGIYYGYVAVDIPLLVSNITGCDAKNWKKQDFDQTLELLKELITVITTVSPGAKLGSTAPYAYSDFMLLESGKKQPRSLANAFLKSVSLKSDPMQAAVDSLSRYLVSIDSMYGQTADSRAVATIKDWTEPSVLKGSAPDMTKRILQQIFEK